MTEKKSASIRISYSPCKQQQINATDTFVSLKTVHFLD